jgi:putative membrane-bound dehydrogenase-like protein
VLLSAAPPELKPGDLPRIPPTPPAKAVETFTVRPGFHIELMAAEPLIVSPVAMAFDENGKLYVVEMIDYSERRDEKLSRVKLLEDTDGDSRYDKASIFADGLPWATGVACWDGGVFVLATPDLTYFKDTDGDGRADVHALVATGFGNASERLNVQALPNSLQWGPDQRIHGALGGNAGKLTNFARKGDQPLELRGRDFSFDPRDLQLRPEIGGGQWGMTFDNIGRKFICNNSRHLVQLLYDTRALVAGIPLPPPAVDIAVDGPQAEVFRTSPDEGWRVIRTQWRVSGAVRGMIEGGGRSSGYFTSANSVTIYRGDAYPAEYWGNAFTADCGSNLIHRKVLSGDVQLKAERAPDEQKSEFAASSDNWFRPVALANAPDGCLWAADMMREVIEHPWSLPEPLKSQLDLNAGNDRGRLWRFVPDGLKPRPIPKLGALSSDELVKLLANSNGWHRDTAARLLHQRQDKSVTPALRTLATTSNSPLGRLTALRVLQGYDALDEATAARALSDQDATVRVQAIRTVAAVYDRRAPSSEAPDRHQTALKQALITALPALSNDASPAVRYELLWTLSSLSGREKSSALLKIASRDSANPWMRAALLTATGDAAGELFAASAKDTASAAFTRELASVIGSRNRPEEVKAVLAYAVAAPDSATVLAPLADGLSRAKSSLSAADPDGRLKPLIAAAEERLRPPGKPTAADIALLGLAGNASSAEAVTTALAAGLDTPRATAALETLRRLNPAQLGDMLTRAWPKLPPDVRPAAVRLWRSRAAQTPSLLTAIASGTITRTDLSAEDIVALRESKDAAVKARAVELLGASSTRDSALATYRPSLEMNGDTTKGHTIFQTRCVICHRFRGEGIGVGPDLDASATAGREKLLGNIVDPSREITAGFTMATVETKSGETVVGIIIAETDGALTLRLPGGPVRNLARVDVATIERSARSLMPEGIEAGLTPQEMADLLAFLSAPKPAAK